MTLLPNHKSKFDKKFDELFGIRFDEFDIGVINTLADSCPVSLLPILAASFDVDIEGLSEIAARELIKNAFAIHYYSGTFYAVKKAVQAIDSGALIIEGNLGQKYDGSILHGGARFYGSNDHWAEYSVISSIPLSREKAKRISDAAKSAAPVRCVLTTIDSRAANLTYDGSIRYNDQFNYGVY
ncbi:phage tail protein [Campylobacter sp. RM9344]|uniref:Phage tail protein n=1 Tax=Campylobacter californiensis TaxID=1032243 RepID=A0AAW3ZUM0_9BACT|nr:MULTISPECIES: phage tail protein [unclassified Campylobacter]MBE2985449.1 phage tail protein [Campylobacter sp. RM6883]MBE2994559.1 phage tail protein [Campylobacter sp. RM6913]MBE3029699.1 phage tail protein [Campylobacter sp. RM9344]MBE3607184.1 phage tail protein [Campylobacter sp. RM9337]MBE3609516.1 phage tail protein [Campylobacter sp. RM12916]